MTDPDTVLDRIDDPPFTRRPPGARPATCDLCRSEAVWDRSGSRYCDEHAGSGTRCISGRPLTPTGASLDYCSEDCQEEWQGGKRREGFQLAPAAADAEELRPGATNWSATVPFRFLNPEAVREAIEHLRLVETLEVTVPDNTERTRLLDAAGGDLQRAISLAQWGIPPELAQANPGADIHYLAHRAHIDRSTT